MLKLKIDLHIHTTEDSYDRIVKKKKHLPAPESIIQKAYDGLFGVLAFISHRAPFNNTNINPIALERDILLIPGVESVIEGKHVLLYNFPTMEIKTFELLRKYKRADNLVVAPHPFFRTSECLGKRLIENIECFDAIELNPWYTDTINFNMRAVKIAREYGLPLIASSDTHRLDDFGRHFSMIECQEKTIDSVIASIKQNKIEIFSRPYPFLKYLKKMFLELIYLLIYTS